MPDLTGRPNSFLELRGRSTAARRVPRPIRATPGADRLIASRGSGRFAFSTADGFGALALGRALIGVGVASALMARFKVIVLWCPRERVPLVMAAS